MQHTPQTDALIVRLMCAIGEDNQAASVLAALGEVATWGIEKLEPDEGPRLLLVTEFCKCLVSAAMGIDPNRVNIFVSPPEYVTTTPQ